MSNINALTSATTQFIRYTPIPLFILGLIGNIFNILIFTRRSLFKNPCTVYFLSTTCANIIVLFVGLLIRSLIDGFDIDIIGNSLVLCRLRYILFHPSSVLSSWFLVLASIDRFCISSQNIRLRTFSHLSIARRTVIVASCVCLLMYIHILGLFEIKQLESGPYCYAKVGFYRVFYDFLFFVSFSFIPPILMMIMGLATVRNIRLARTRVGTTSLTMVGQLNKKDRQLVFMLLLQLITTIVCTLPYAILKLYLTFTVNDAKNSYRSAIENLVFQITRQLSYINAGMSFYLYITAASSSIFRREFGQIIDKIIALIFGTNSRIHRLIRNGMRPDCQANPTIAIEQIVTTSGRIIPSKDQIQNKS